MKFSAIFVFILLWSTFIYFPVAHNVWYWAGPDAIAEAVMKDQLLIQAKTVLFTLLYSVIGSAVLYKFADLAIGLRVSKQAEIEGLDISDHGERVTTFRELSASPGVPHTPGEAG